MIHVPSTVGVQVRDLERLRRGERRIAGNGCRQPGGSAGRRGKVRPSGRRGRRLVMIQLGEPLARAPAADLHASGHPSLEVLIAGVHGGDHGPVEVADCPTQHHVGQEPR